MAEAYLTINLRSFLDEKNSMFTGEDALKNGILSNFSCPKNPDVERFLLRGAIPSTLQKKSATYLVVGISTRALVGYFSIAARPFAVDIDNMPMNRKAKDRMKRVSYYDETLGKYLTSAFLIAQLGKNYAIKEECRISGDELLGLAFSTVRQIQSTVGGLVQFIECEDKEPLLNFYERNGFVRFGQRMTNETANSEPHLLHQLFKFID